MDVGVFSCYTSWIGPSQWCLCMYWKGKPGTCGFSFSKLGFFHTRSAVALCVCVYVGVRVCALQFSIELCVAVGFRSAGSFSVVTLAPTRPASGASDLPEARGQTQSVGSLPPVVNWRTAAFGRTNQL